ncbi:MAG: WD40 repeat domain-containing protein [Candidatus Babeliaceae bacterium]|nr:WD40 repeat domain-containing protein [Candidatus Babeliaceae bacterium]
MKKFLQLCMIAIVSTTSSTLIFSGESAQVQPGMTSVIEKLAQVKVQGEDIFPKNFAKLPLEMQERILDLKIDQFLKALLQSENSFIKLITFKISEKDVLTLELSPDGTRLAGGFKSGAVKIWDVQTGTLIATLESSEGEVNSLSWSPNGTRLAGGFKSGVVKVWDVQTGQPVRVLRRNENLVKPWAWNSDSTRLATIPKILLNDQIQTPGFEIWNPQTNELIATLEAPEGNLSSEAWQWSPDGTRLAGGFTSGDIMVWDTQTGQPVGALSGPRTKVSSMAWSPDSTQLAGGFNNGAVKVWNAQTGQLIATLQLRGDWSSFLAWSPDGTKLGASSLLSDTTRVWNVQTGQLIATLQGSQNRKKISSLVWSPDSIQLARSSRAGIRVWDTQTARLIAVLNYAEGKFLSVGWSLDGASLVSGLLENGDIVIAEDISSRLNKYFLKEIVGKNNRIEQKMLFVALIALKQPGRQLMLEDIVKQNVGLKLPELKSIRDSFPPTIRRLIGKILTSLTAS